MRFSSPAWWLLAACGGDDPLAERHEACDPAATYERVAQPVLSTWCTPCHGTYVTGTGRSGAPEDVDFDTRNGLVTWYARITARMVDEPTMPPAGGVPDADRADLLGWIACGMPGLPDDPEPAFCDQASTIAGPVSASGLCAGEPLIVDGDLTIDADVDLDCVCEVLGSVVVGQVTTVRLGPMTRIGRELDVLASSVETLEAPNLTYAEEVNIEGSSALSTLDLRALVVAGDGVSISGSALGRIELDALASAEFVSLTDHAAATLVSLDHLLELDEGSLTLARMPLLQTVRGTQTLEIVPGSLVLEDLGPVGLDGFGHIASLGGSLIVRRTGVTSLSGFDRVLTVSGDVIIEDNASLQTLWGLADLERVQGDLRIVGNPLLTRVDSELPWLTDIDGSLVIDANDALVDLSILPSLETIGVDLAVRDNPVLPSSQAAALALRVAVGRDILISGNAP